MGERTKFFNKGFCIGQNGRGDMKLRRYRIRTRMKNRDPFTIALVSDFHNGNAAAVSAALDSCRPDLIAVAGDLFLGYQYQGGPDFFSEQENVLPLIRHCAKLAPTYLSLGNHEWGGAGNGIKDAGKRRCCHPR